MLLRLDEALDDRRQIILKEAEGQIIIFDKDGEEVYIQAGEDSKVPLELLLIGGVPLNEPVARYGPFVMNTQQEIYQAIEDYRSGKLGRIIS